MRKLILIPILFLTTFSFAQRVDTLLANNGRLVKDTATVIVGGYLITPTTTSLTFDSSKVVTLVSKNITGDSLYIYKGGIKVAVLPLGGAGWATIGNAGTVAGTNFIGTTDNVDFLIKRNNLQAALFLSDNTFMGSSAGSGITGIGSTTVGNFMVGTNAAKNSGAPLNMNVLGYGAYQNGTGTGNSNIFGLNAASGANVSYSFIAGRSAGYAGTNITYSTIIGDQASYGGTNTHHAVVLGAGTAYGSTGLSYSTIIGSSVCGSAQFSVTGVNNIVIGTNITTPAATSSNIINLGNVFYGVNAYATTTGAQSKVAQKTSRISVGIETPDTSAILDLTSNTMGILIPRMTTAQRKTLSGGIGFGGAAAGARIAGSGYTNGVYPATALTGGSGMGAMADITVASGQVISVNPNITNGAQGIGSGYQVGDILSASGIGGGTGFTFTLIAISKAATGLQIYNTDQNQINRFNGVNWTGDYITSAAGTLSILYGDDYTFTGSTATCTLPVPSATLLGRQNAITITNLGTGAITVTSATGSQVIDIGTVTATSTISLASGTSTMLMPYGTGFKALYKQ